MEKYLVRPDQGILLVKNKEKKK